MRHSLALADATVPAPVTCGALPTKELMQERNPGVAAWRCQKTGVASPFEDFLGSWLDVNIHRRSLVALPARPSGLPCSPLSPLPRLTSVETTFPPLQASTELTVIFRLTIVVPQFQLGSATPKLRLAVASHQSAAARCIHTERPYA